MEEKTILQRIRELNVGENLQFPVKQTRTIRNYCSLLNSEFFLGDKKRWVCQLKREMGFITIGRIE